MPKIYHSFNPLKSQMTSLIFKISLLWFTAFFLIVLLDVLKVLPYYGYFFLAFVSLVTHYWGRQLKIILNGIGGESKAFKKITTIPKSYSVFTNVLLRFDGRENESDLIIVGPKGVFVIEVKNHSGVITGKEQEKNWVQFKITRAGGKYINPFYNPLKQVSTHVFRLSQILKNEGLPVWIQSLVMFTHPDVEVKAESKKVPIIKPGVSFAEYLESYKPRVYLKKQEQEQIVRILKKQLKVSELKHKKNGSYSLH